MATINFYLDRPDRKNFRPIFLVYQNDSKKLKYFTKLKIEEKSWNNKTQLVKGGFSYASQVNINLTKIKGIVEKIVSDALYEEVSPTPEYVKKLLHDRLGNDLEKSDFHTYFDKYISDSETIKGKNTIKSYVTVYNKLKEFEEVKAYTLTFKNINADFYQKYIDFIVKDLKQLNNSAGKHIKIIKSFMNYCILQGVKIKNEDFKKFKVFREDIDIIYLDEKELQKIYELEGLSTTHEYVKDNFCFACYTGLRFSDLSMLENENFKDDFVEIKTKKTKAFLRIPLTFYTKAILKKYKNMFAGRPLPPVLSNQKTNEYLKEIAKKAKINDPISMTKYNGSIKVSIKEPKHNLITTHTARRTFVTLSLERGMRAEVVMEMTGHKDYRTFKKYIKITDNVKSIEMNKIWGEKILKIV